MNNQKKRTEEETLRILITQLLGDLTQKQLQIVYSVVYHLYVK